MIKTKYSINRIAEKKINKQKDNIAIGKIKGRIKIKKMLQLS